MAWWVKKTGVARSVWQALGVEEYESGVKFSFEGEAYYKYRKPPKDFGWSQQLGPEAPPLWPMPMDELPSEITITVGESDCGTAHAAGLPFAFCCTKGDDTALTTIHFEALANRGVSSVLIVSDSDGSGLEGREKMERAAVDADLDVRVVELEKVIDPFSGGKDLNWVYRNTETLEQFRHVIAKATRDARTFDPTMTYEEMNTLLQDDELWFVPELVAPSDKAMIVGPQKSYKTWIKLDLTKALIRGTPFLNRTEWQPTTPRKVLLVQEEGSRRRWASRMRKLELTQDEWDTYLKVWHRQGFRFTDDEMVSSVISYMREHDIEVVFFDPLQRMIPGVDENDSNATGVVWDAVMRMQQAIPGLVVFVIHHANKAERLTWESVRGSSRHAGEVDLGVFVEKHPVENDKIKLKVDGRDVAAEMGAGEAFEASVTIEDDSFIIDAASFKAKLTPSQSDENLLLCLNALRDGAETRQEVQRETGLSDLTVRKYLKQMLEAGTIVTLPGGPRGAKIYKEVE